MDTTQCTLLAEYEFAQRQEQLLRSAERWYLHEETPPEPPLRAALADLLLTLAAWIAPASETKEAARTLARG